MATKDKLVSLEVLKAVKTNLDTKDANADRRLNALYDLTQGQAWSMQTVATTANPVNVPSGAKLASMSEMSGKSVVWNQITSHTSPIPVAGAAFNNTAGVLTVTNKQQWVSVMITNHANVPNHVLYGAVDMSANKPDCVYMQLNGGGKQVMSTTVKSTNYETLRSFITTGTNDSPIAMYLGDTSTGDFKEYKAKNYLLCDLTQMFGAGNQPTTTDDPRIRFIEQYASEHPEYNAGEIVSYGTKEVVGVGKNKIKMTDVIENYWPDSNQHHMQNVAQATTFFAKVNRNTVYTFSKNNGDRSSIIGVNEPPSINVSFTDADVVYNGGITTEKVATFNSGQHDYVMIYTNRYKSTRPTQCQLEEGSSATAYEPYKEQSIAIPESILALDGYGMGINDTVRNYIEWADDGKVYYHKMVGTFTYEGNGYFGMYTTSGGYNVAYLNVNTLYNMKRTDEYRTCMIASNRTVGKHSSALNDGEVSGYSISNGTYPGQNWLYVRIDELTTGEQYKEALKGLTIYYELATPEVIDITNLMPWDGTVSAETGGTITFKADGDALLPIHTTIQYAVKNAEVM